jgi:hypothetical protein
MQGNAKALKRMQGILIGPLMAPRFFRPSRFRHRVFHSPSKSRSRLRAQISRRGWQADVTSRVCQTRTPSPAGHRSSGISSTSSRPSRIRMFTELLRYPRLSDLRKFNVLALGAVSISSHFSTSNSVEAILWPPHANTNGRLVLLRFLQLSGRNGSGLSRSYNSRSCMNSSFSEGGRG